MKRGKKKAWFYSMPFLIIVGLMIVVPLLYTVEISFTNMSIYHWKDYHCVGLDNYKKALLAFFSVHKRYGIYQLSGGEPVAGSSVYVHDDGRCHAEY